MCIKIGSEVAAISYILDRNLTTIVRSRLNSLESTCPRPARAHGPIKKLGKI
jgi:hypothetical protein